MVEAQLQRTVEILAAVRNKPLMLASPSNKVSLPAFSSPFLFERPVHDKIHVKIKPLQGEPFVCEMQSKTAFVLSLKMEIGKHLGITVAEQKLLMGTKSLMDHKCLLDYGIDGKTQPTITLAKIKTNEEQSVIVAAPQSSAKAPSKAKEASQDTFWKEVTSLLLDRYSPESVEAILMDWKAAAAKHPTK